MLKQNFKRTLLARIASSFLLASVVQGCISTSSNTHCYLDVDGYYQNCGNQYSNYDVDTSTNYSQSTTSAFVPEYTAGSMHFKLLDEYAEQLAFQLTEGINHPVYGGIAVASFVYLDSELKTSSVLGNQFSENLIHELQQYGLPVVDTKVSPSIKVADTGDFIFSRKSTELAHNLDYEYVLSGTMVKESHGILLQSRIINIRNKQVLTTATKFIPSLIVSTLGG